MADHPNAELFRRGYRAFQQGDLDTVRSLFADDVVWNFAGRSKYAGAHRGADEVLGIFGEQMQETNGTFKVEPHDILANDTHGVALATVSGERNGKKLNDRYTHVVHIKDGKLTESWIFQEDQERTDAFWD